jgi:hypothetical protein
MALHYVSSDELKRTQTGSVRHGKASAQFQPTLCLINFIMALGAIPLMADERISCAIMSDFFSEELALRIQLTEARVQVSRSLFPAVCGAERLFPFCCAHGQLAAQSIVFVGVICARARAEWGANE